jgi:hypothetical protein
MITINGHSLNEGQAMTVRVAIGHFQMSLSEEADPLGDDEHGKFITKAYQDRLREVVTLMRDGDEP